MLKTYILTIDTNQIKEAFIWSLPGIINLEPVDPEEPNEYDEDICH